MSAKQTIRSDISWSNRTHIFIHGHDLCKDLIGKASFGDMAFLELTGRLPNERESAVFNAIAITLVEHGLTPSVIAARMTLCGAPEAMQAAVAAGVSGLGTVMVGSTEAAARDLQTAIPFGKASGGNVMQLAQRIVDDYIASKCAVPGIGHPFHKPVDPRAPRLFEVAEENGFVGQYVELMKAISTVATERTGKGLPVNATGAIAALASELQLPWNIVKGIGVMARAIGIVGHLLEEMKNPMARQVHLLVESAAEQKRSQRT